ncbi:MAG: glycosyltransferase family 2 protein [Acidobacteria bacterium]|nr:glycosyltransferase family 2 protein [Acidobacteriota bacterium]
MQSCDLDISVVTYHSGRWLEGFVRSILASDLDLNRVRLLFMDHSSDRKCVDELEDLRRRHGSAFSGFEIRRQRNRGFGGGHNANLKHAKAPYFLVTNIDLEFEPTTLSRLLSCAAQSGDNVASWEPRQKPYEHPKNYNQVTMETLWSSHACVLLRTQALRQVGGYERWLFLYGEDVELSYRLRDRGYVLKYCPQAVVWHYTYDEAYAFKWRQFLGSSLANFFIRLRYGTLGHIAYVPLMYANLWRCKSPFPWKYARLLLAGMELVAKAPFFLLSRRTSKARFPIRGYDYLLARDGAFEVLEPYPAETPLVSVIIRTYQGRQGFLQEAIQSVFNQTYRPIEILVVEDGTDYAALWLKTLKVPEGINIRHLPVEKGGRCVAGNRGLEAAQGEFVNFLDDDDLFFADHLETLVIQLQANPQCGAVYGNAWEVATRVHSTDPLSYTEVMHSGRYRQPFSRRLLWRQNYIPIQTILFRQSLFRAHGGFDLELDALEDWHLWIKYSLDADFVYVPKTTSIYRTPADPDVASERQEHLDRYYDEVIAKLGKMVIKKSADELLKYLN